MAEHKSIRLETHQIDAIEDMVDRGEADNQSEALRRLLNSGMAQYGYRAGKNGNTTLKTFTHRLMWAFALIGIVWMATTLAAPVALRMPAYAAMSASVGMFGVYRVLEAHEPAVTNKLRSLLGGEPA
jgi:hypothetical protein